MEPAEKLTRRIVRMVVMLFAFILAIAIGEAFGSAKGVFGLVVFVTAALVGALGVDLFKSLRH
jgi:hypothetical protein